MNGYRLLAIAGATLCGAVGVVIGSLSAEPLARLKAPASFQGAPPPAAPAEAPPSAALAENAIDTSITPPPPARHAAPPPKAPKVTRVDDIHRVRTPSDEELPRWVPVRGRLTVVDSADLAENLGLVPKGSTKRSAERISVAEKLEEGASPVAYRAAPTEWLAADIARDVAPRRSARARR